MNPRVTTAWSPSRYGPSVMGSGKAVRRTTPTTLLMMALVGVVCLLAIVLSGLALSKVTSLDPANQDKVWTFAVGEGNLNLHYIDGQTLEMDGFDVDMVKMVCKMGGKRCRVVTDDYSNCWGSQKEGEPARGGEGLLAGWYDACVGWSQTYERRRTFAFTEPYTKPLPSVFFAKYSNFSSADLAGKKIGFLDGYADDEHCLNRQSDIQNLPLQTDQIVHFASPELAQSALMNNKIDAVFTTKYVSMPDAVRFDARQFNCTTRGRSVMTRMQSGLTDWWNPAWEKVWSAKAYHLMCQTLEIRHGRFKALPYEEICLHL